MKDGKDWLHTTLGREREWEREGRSNQVRRPSFVLFDFAFAARRVHRGMQALMNIAYMCITGGRFGRLKGYRGYHHQIAVSDQSSPHIHTWNEKEILKFDKNPTITLGSPQ